MPTYKGKEVELGYDGNEYFYYMDKDNKVKRKWIVGSDRQNWQHGGYMDTGNVLKNATFYPDGRVVFHASKAVQDWRTGEVLDSGEKARAARLVAERKDEVSLVKGFSYLAGAGAIVAANVGTLGAPAAFEAAGVSAAAGAAGVEGAVLASEEAAAAVVQPIVEGVAEQTGEAAVAGDIEFSDFVDAMETTTETPETEPGFLERAGLNQAQIDYLKDTKSGALTAYNTGSQLYTFTKHAADDDLYSAKGLIDTGVGFGTNALGARAIARGANPIATKFMYPIYGDVVANVAKDSLEHWVSNSEPTTREIESEVAATAAGGLTQAALQVVDESVDFGAFSGAINKTSEKVHDEVYNKVYNHYNESHKESDASRQPAEWRASLARQIAEIGSATQ